MRFTLVNRKRRLWLGIALAFAAWTLILVKEGRTALSVAGVVPLLFCCFKSVTSRSRILSVLENEVRLEGAGREDVALSRAQVKEWEIWLDKVRKGPYGTEIKDPFFILRAKDGTDIRLRLSESREAHLALFNWVTDGKLPSAAGPVSAYRSLYPASEKEILAKLDPALQGQPR